MSPDQVMNTSTKELLYLAEQERHARGMLRDDDYGEARASMVREWALRKCASALTAPSPHTPADGGSRP